VGGKDGFGKWNTPPDRGLVVTVSVVEAAEFAPGVTAAGENPQEAPAGNPAHAN